MIGDAPAARPAWAQLNRTEHPVGVPAAGLPGVPFGARPYCYDGALAVRRMPCSFGTLTLGGVILRAGDPADLVVRPCAARMCPGARERAHVLHYLVLVPLFLPRPFRLRRRFRLHYRLSAPRMFRD